MTTPTAPGSRPPSLVTAAPASGAAHDPLLARPLGRRGRSALSGCLVAALLATACHPRAPVRGPARPAAAAAFPAPTLLAHAALPSGTTLEGLVVGGLSDLDYDARRDIYWAIVDDAYAHPPARLLSLRWHPPAVPEPLAWLPLLEADGSPLGTEGADLEGLALTPEGNFVVSAEGYVDGGFPPWVAVFDTAGKLTQRLPLPAHYLIAPGRGPRNNAALEALALLADGDVVAGMEGALQQDEPPAGDSAGDQRLPGRLLRWAFPLDGGPREWLYPLDPPHAPAPFPGALRVAGLVDILPVPEGGFLTLERSFVAGVGFRLRLYLTDLAAAAEVTGRDSLAVGAPAPLAKRLVLDLATLGVPLHNYEGLAWGPPGPGGESTLVVVSDNNFSTEPTHWLALRWPR
jgi:hypothetical protein